MSTILTKGSRISQSSLNPVLLFLKRLGIQTMLFSNKEQKYLSHGPCKNTGFDKFKRLRLTKWLGRLSFSDLKV